MKFLNTNNSNRKFPPNYAKPVLEEFHILMNEIQEFSQFDYAIMLS